MNQAECSVHLNRHTKFVFFYSCHKSDLFSSYRLSLYFIAVVVEIATVTSKSLQIKPKLSEQKPPGLGNIYLEIPKSSEASNSSKTFQKVPRLNSFKLTDWQR